MAWGKESLKAAYSETTIIVLDPTGAFLLGESNLLEGVGWHGWCDREEWGLGAVSILISDEADLSQGAVREGEPVWGGRESFIIYMTLFCNLGI